jgi:hypothetical protein
MVIPKLKFGPGCFNLTVLTNSFFHFRLIDLRAESSLNPKFDPGC